jgi:hypothetical protein
LGYSATTNNDKDKTDDRHENANQELGLTQIHQNNKQADKQPSQQENKKDHRTNRGTNFTRTKEQNIHDKH